MTRKALGRGLSALLGEAEAPTADLEQVDVTQIDPNPYQPRRSFPEASLQELADSIRASGVVQPVLLRQAGGRYQVIVGERRWRAAKLAGMPKIPAFVKELGDREAVELALTENLLREDLNPVDAAHGFDLLQQKYQLSHEEIAARMGVNRSTVTNTLRLLRLPPPVQAMLANGEISFGHARALLSLDSEASQTQLANMIIKQGLSVRQVETMVALRPDKPRKREAAGSAPKLDPNVRAAVLELERTLGTRVRVVGNEKRGRIEISYFSSEDLNRIYDWITRR